MDAQLREMLKRKKRVVVKIGCCYNCAETGVCGDWTGKADDDVSENVFRVSSDGRTGTDDKEYYEG